MSMPLIPPLAISVSIYGFGKMQDAKNLTRYAYCTKILVPFTPGTSPGELGGVGFSL